MRNFVELQNMKRLLRRHDVPPLNWVEMRQRGFSGARIYKQSNYEGISHVLKVTSPQTDWIMRATSDDRCREAVMANAACVRHEQINSPAIGSARDGAVFSILMHDISDYLLKNERLTNSQFDTILLGMGRLHSMLPPSDYDVPWCSIENRLTIFMPDPGKLEKFRIANDILRGWELFFEYAPKKIAELVRSLFKDIGPLKKALGQLPSCLLHGDLKLDNIGICPGGALSLIDWAMPMIAPAAVELGWFLAMNSRSLPMSLDEAIVAYASYSNIENKMYDRHQSLTILCGLLIRGWRKALDASSGEPSEFLWWCERASSASKIL